MFFTSSKWSKWCSFGSFHFTFSSFKLSYNKRDETVHNRQGWKLRPDCNKPAVTPDIPVHWGENLNLDNFSVSSGLVASTLRNSSRLWGQFDIVVQRSNYKVMWHTRPPATVTLICFLTTKWQIWFIGSSYFWKLANGTANSGAYRQWIIFCFMHLWELQEPTEPHLWHHQCSSLSFIFGNFC